MSAAKQSTKDKNSLYDEKVHGKPFSVGDLVWLYMHTPAVPRGKCRKLNHPCNGPFQILQRVSDSTYKNNKIKCLKGNKMQCVHFDRFKPVSSSVPPISIPEPPPPTHEPPPPPPFLSHRLLLLSRHPLVGPMSCWRIVMTINLMASIFQLMKILLQFLLDDTLYDKEVVMAPTFNIDRRE